MHTSIWPAVKKYRHKITAWFYLIFQMERITQRFKDKNSKSYRITNRHVIWRTAFPYDVTFSHRKYLWIYLVASNKITWGITVTKLVGWVGVGICLKNVISKANFCFNYSNINHGSYMISNNGYSWSHSAVDFNSTHKAFHFGTGDTIYL